MYQEGQERASVPGNALSLSPGVCGYVVLLPAIITWETEVLLPAPGVHAQPTLLLADWPAASTACPYGRRAAEVAPVGLRFHHSLLDLLAKRKDEGHLDAHLRYFDFRLRV